MANFYLSTSQIYDYAIGGGFGTGEAGIAAAIAMAESSGDPYAHTVTRREDSRGLWQINVRAHPEYASVNLYDPGVNAAVAHELYTRRGGWGDWSTYLNGSYRQYLGNVPRGMVPPASVIVNRVGVDPRALLILAGVLVVAWFLL